MDSLVPFVTVIIPCRNEERYIGRVLQNILNQDYPRKMMEIYFVDGESDDKTVAVINKMSEGHDHIWVLNNPDRIVPHAMNIAIKQSRGDVIVRMDAHSEYPENYVSTLVKALFEFDADNVGGIWITIPGDSTDVAKAISLAMSHPFGIGNAKYRVGINKPTWTDTVPYGCYRKETFNKIGLFDEQLMRNQDDEFNGRLIKNGGRILLLPDVHIIYYARENLRKMSLMFFQYGLFKPLVNLKLGKPATIRQLFPPALVLSLLLLTIGAVFNELCGILLILEIVIYLLMNLIFSYKLAGTINSFINLLKIFPSIHFSYGWGYLKGIWKFVLLKEHKRNG